MTTGRVRKTEMKREGARESCVRMSVISVALLILCFNREVIGKCSTHEELRNGYKVLIITSLGKGLRDKLYFIIVCTTFIRW